MPAAALHDESGPEHVSEELSSRYWYETGDDAERLRSVAILQAMRAYRAGEAAMRRRTRDSMSMGENDLLVLRYLLKAKQQERAVAMPELAAYLAVSTSAARALVARLERSGHLVSEGEEVRTTVESDAEVRATLGQMHERMLEAAGGMSPDEGRAVVAFLGRMLDAVDRIDAHEIVH